MGRTAAVMTVTVLLTLGVGATACSDDSTSDSTTTEKAATTTAASKKNFAVSTPNGEVSLSLNGKLPPDWPSDFPLPDGAEPVGSGSLANSESGTMIGVYSTEQSGEDAYGFYTAESTLQPSEQKSVGVGTNFIGRMKISGQFDGSVTVAAGDTTYIVVILETAGANSSSTSTSATASESSTTTTTAESEGSTTSTT